MTKAGLWARVACVSVAVVATCAISGAAAGMQATVKGYVIDSACTFKNHLKKPVSTECAEKCARAGSPLVIQTEDGTIYLPISGEMPAVGQNDTLMKYAGRLVTVNGKVYTRGGSRAIVIEKIEVAKN